MQATTPAPALEGPMSLSVLLLFIHITLMFAAVGVSYGGSLLLRIAYMSGQVGPLKGVGYALARSTKWIPVLYIAGGIVGLLTAISFSYSLLAPWLVIAYVLFAIAMVIGAGPNRTWGERFGKLIATTPDGPTPAAVRELFDARAVVALSVIDLVVIVLLIFDMVVKPFS
jgi:hypothetical protein